jgi:hypothetical protein
MSDVRITVAAEMALARLGNDDTRANAETWLARHIAGLRAHGLDDHATELQRRVRVQTGLLVGSLEGLRFRLVRNVERYPQFVAPAGAVGTVVTDSAAELHGYVALKLDAPVPGMEPWDGEVHWYADFSPDAERESDAVMDFLTAARLVLRDEG